MLLLILVMHKGSHQSQNFTADGGPEGAFQKGAMTTVITVLCHNWHCGKLSDELFSAVHLSTTYESMWCILAKLGVPDWSSNWTGNEASYCT